MLWYAKECIFYYKMHLFQVVEFEFALCAV